MALTKTAARYTATVASLTATDTTIDITSPSNTNLNSGAQYGLTLTVGTNTEYAVGTWNGTAFINCIRGVNPDDPLSGDTYNKSPSNAIAGTNIALSITNYPLLAELRYWVNQLRQGGASGDRGIEHVISVTTNTTLTTDEENYLIRVTTGDTDKTITLPAIPSGDTFNIWIQKIDSGTGKVVVSAGSNTINGETGNYDKMVAPGDNAHFVGNGTNWNAIGGDLAQPNDIINIEDEGNERIFTRRSGQTLRLPITVPHPHSISFSGQDNDTVPASDVNAGEIGIYEADGTTQIQNGDINRARVIYIANAQATYGQDATSPGTNLQAVDTQPFLGDIMNGGQVIVSIQRRGETSWVYFVVGSVQRYGTEGYRLNVSAVSGSYSTSGTGYSWNVVITPAHPESVHNIVDLDTLGYIKREEIVGKETDRYASYNNALIGSGYRTGDWCLFNQATAPTDDSNAVRQPDIADRNADGVVVFGQKLRTDRDPNNFVEAPASAATDYKSGDVIYASIWNKPDARIAITLTSGGTLVGTGDAAYIWATATWDEIGEIPASDVVDYGDYFQLSKEEPTQTILGITKAMREFLPTRELDDSDEINIDTPLLLENFKHTDLGDLVTWHDEHHVGTFTTDGLTYTTNSSPPNNNEVNYIQFAGDTTRGVISYKYPNDIARDRLKAKIVIGRAFTLKVGTATVVGKIASTPANLFGRLSFNLNEVVESGTRTAGTAAEIITDSNIPARTQLSEVAFSGKAADVDVDATGFNGNLSTDDDDVQKVAQKFDDFTAEITPETIASETEATDGDGKLQLLGATLKPTYDASADYAQTSLIDNAASFVSGGTRYVLGFGINSRSLFVKKGSGTFTEKTNQLTSANAAPKSMTLSVATDGTISILVVNVTGTSVYVYTFNTSNDTLSFVAARTIQSGLRGGCQVVNNGGSYELWIHSGTNEIQVYDTDEKFASLTYQSSKNFNSPDTNALDMTIALNNVFMQYISGAVVAFNFDRTVNPDLSFVVNHIENSVGGAMYADDEHIFIDDTGNKFYAYSLKGGLVKKTIPQDEVDLQKKIADTPTAVAGDGNVRMIGRVGGNIAPTYDSAADFTNVSAGLQATDHFQSSCSFVSGGTRYTIFGLNGSRNVYVRSGTQNATLVSNVLDSDNSSSQGMDAVILSDGTVRIVTVDSSSDKAFLYTFNTSNNTFTLVTSVNLQSANDGASAVVIVPSGSGYMVYAADGGSGEPLFAYTATSTFTTITASASNNISGVDSQPWGMTRAGNVFYVFSSSTDTAKAYTLTGARSPSLDFSFTSENTLSTTAFSTDTHLFNFDTADDKWYAYRFETPYSMVGVDVPQDALKPPVLVYSSASKEIDGTYATVGTDLLADTDGSLIMTFAYDNNGSGQYLPQTVRMLKSRITTTEQRIPVVASVVGGNQSWGIQKSGNNLQVKQYGIASDRSIVDIWSVPV